MLLRLRLFLQNHVDRRIERPILSLDAVLGDQMILDDVDSSNRGHSIWMSRRGQRHFWDCTIRHVPYSRTTGIPALARNKNKTVGLVIVQLITAITFGMVFLSAAPLRVHAEEFYKGKTIKFVVGYSPGGCSIVSPDSLRATSVNTFQEIQTLL